MIDRLKQYIAKQVQVSEEELEQFSNLFKHKKVKKKELLLREGDMVIAYGTYTGTYKKTNKSFSARVAHLWKLKDEKIIRFEQIVDSQPVNDVLK